MKLTKIEIEALKNVLSKIDNFNSDVLQKLNERLNNDMKITMYIDGAADLNSKTAGIGGVIYKNNEELFTFSEYLHDSTNNEAEYTALIKGLESLIELQLLNVKIYADCHLLP